MMLRNLLITQLRLLLKLKPPMRLIPRELLLLLLNVLLPLLPMLLLKLPLPLKHPHQSHLLPSPTMKRN